MTAATEFLFDALLCLGLLWLACQIVTTRPLFRGVVLFMVFGLLMAATWARLGVPDLALAEAAVGAGIIGALLMGACKAVLTDPGSSREPGPGPRAGLPRPLAAGLSGLVGGVLAWLMIVLPGAGGPTPQAVTAKLPGHFLDNPVTAVLLDLRAYDTLMEMVVILLAFIGARALFRQSDLPTLFASQPARRQLAAPLLALATPVLLLVSLQILWAGSHAPGGAFQAGALLAALGVMHRLTGRLEPTDETTLGIRILLVLGLLAFSLFACLGIAWTGVPLSFPGHGRHALVLTIELALMVSIALTLTLMFSARPGLRLGRVR